MCPNFALYDPFYIFLTAVSVIRWLKVLDKDGNKTEFWDEYVAQSNGPLPHKNCGTSWLPCWPICLSQKQVNANMIVPNKQQIVRFKKHDDKPMAQTD